MKFGVHAEKAPNLQTKCLFYRFYVMEYTKERTCFILEHIRGKTVRDILVPYIISMNSCELPMLIIRGKPIQNAIKRYNFEMLHVLYPSNNLHKTGYGSPQKKNFTNLHAIKNV